MTRWLSSSTILARLRQIVGLGMACLLGLAAWSIHVLEVRMMAEREAKIRPRGGSSPPSASARGRGSCRRRPRSAAPSTRSAASGTRGASTSG